MKRQQEEFTALYCRLSQDDGRDLLVMLTDIFRRGAQKYGFYDNENWGDDDEE